MRMEIHLSQRQELRQQLSQRMIQNLQMLQMHVLDLREMIMSELEQNPTIEEKQQEPAEVEAGPKVEKESAEDQAKREMLEAFEDQWFESERKSRGSGSSEDADKRMEMMQNQKAKPITLQNHLLKQLSIMEVPGELRDICEVIIQNVDDNGYLKFTLEEIANSLPADLRKAPPPPKMEPPTAAPLPEPGVEPTAELAAKSTAELAAEPTTEPTSPIAAVTEEPTPEPSFMEALVLKVEKALHVIQHMEPKGVGAQSLQECLLLQLDEEDPVYPLLHHMIEHHLEDIGSNRLPKIVKAFSMHPDILRMLGFTPEPNPDEVMEDVKELVSEVQRLNPKPGSNFSTAPTPRVYPEVVLKQVDGKYEIFLEDSYLPAIAVNRAYVTMAKDKTLSKKEREFVKRKLDAGKMLISAIEQRRSTIQRITAQLLKRQMDFFENGIEHLKPLKMQEIADTLGIHVSTVSRAISGKWIETPRGIFPLKFFFASAAPKNEPKMSPFGFSAQEPQDDSTRLSLMGKIREILDGEQKKDPFSDLEIAKKLKERFNITAARRTIAKYREEMNIPSSRLRKQY